MIKVLKNRIKKPINFFIFAVIFLLFLTIDFRYKTDWTCCSDDFDYFSHAETLIIVIKAINVKLRALVKLA